MRTTGCDGWRAEKGSDWRFIWQVDPADMLMDRTCREQKEQSKTAPRDSTGGPVAKTSCSQCRGPGFHPWSAN